MLYFFIPSHMDKDVVLKYYVGKLWRILRVLLNNLVTKRCKAL